MKSARPWPRFSTFSFQSVFGSRYIKHTVTKLMGNTIQRSDAQRNPVLTANFVQICQEFIAVTFQLVCLSRIETTTDVIKPPLVLFLTLVVFTGPYLNTWLLFTENIIMKTWRDDAWMTLFILLSHVVGSLLVWLLVIVWEPPSITGNTIVWNKKKALTFNMTAEVATDAMWKEHHWYVHFIEEMFAVGTLIIGCAYLFWLRQVRRNKPIPEHQDKKDIKIEMKFYMQLTLLVAAVSQAFPSSQLSIHILCYKLWMQTITGNEYFARLGGGVVGLILGCLWCKARKNYHDSIQVNVSPEHEHFAKPPVRLSMHGSSYF